MLCWFCVSPALSWTSPHPSLLLTSGSDFLVSWYLERGLKSNFCKIWTLGDSLIQLRQSREKRFGQTHLGKEIGYSGSSPRPLLRRYTQTCSENLGWGELCTLMEPHSHHTTAQNLNTYLCRGQEEGSQWFSTCGSQLLWELSDPFPSVA